MNDHDNAAPIAYPDGKEHDQAFYDALAGRLARELLEAENGDKEAALRLLTWIIHPIAETMRRLGGI